MLVAAVVDSGVAVVEASSSTVSADVAVSVDVVATVAVVVAVIVEVDGKPVEEVVVVAAADSVLVVSRGNTQYPVTCKPGSGQSTCLHQPRP